MKLRVRRGHERIWYAKLGVSKLCFSFFQDYFISSQFVSFSLCLLAHQTNKHIVFYMSSNNYTVLWTDPMIILIKHTETIPSLKGQSPTFVWIFLLLDAFTDYSLHFPQSFNLFYWKWIRIIQSFLALTGTELMHSLSVSTIFRRTLYLSYLLSLFIFIF